MGFGYVASGPLVRSSYRAAEFYIARQLRREGAAGAASGSRAARGGA
jgi:lipoic acid synthetase